MGEKKKAIALLYRPGEDKAPSVVAKGKGLLAEQIMAIAREHKIPLTRDEQLVEILSTLDLYEEIPQELYQAVAETLAFVYRLTRKMTNPRDSGSDERVLPEM